MSKQSILAKILGLPEGTKLNFDPNNNVLLQSLLTDNNGNQNVLRFTFDKNAPTVRQRIIQQ